jgi:hypothetical protein
MLVESGRYFLLGMYYQTPVFDVHVARALAAWSHDHMTTDVAPHRLPPPGHPETLAKGVPLSACERELWADALGDGYNMGPQSGFR